MSREPGSPTDWSRISLSFALLVAFAALLLALMSRQQGRCGEEMYGRGRLPRLYSWPATEIAFASRLDSAEGSVTGAEHAPLAHR